MAEQMALSDRDRTILDLESSWWQYEGAKTTQIRLQLDLTPTRYYQIVSALIDQQAAIEYAPMTCRRLRNLRDARRSARSARSA